MRPLENHGTVTLAYHAAISSQIPCYHEKIQLTDTLAPTGSKVDIPKDLLDQIRYIEELFTVDATKLKTISDHFVSELAKGMELVFTVKLSGELPLITSLYRSQCRGRKHCKHSHGGQHPSLSLALG